MSTTPDYALKRNKILRKNSDYLDPERFQNSKLSDKYAYFSFIKLLRIQIGFHFSLQNNIIILATLLTKLSFNKAQDKIDPKPLMTVTLHPEGGA